MLSTIGRPYIIYVGISKGEGRGMVGIKSYYALSSKGRGLMNEKGIVNHLKYKLLWQKLKMEFLVGSDARWDP